ncbi:hypothetical protein DCO58_05325 [Helicobacter saguini]|uniref:Calcineurin-like phosphoesterase domain-containing protein n=1 Tax=Helicobacter saguini TaxID=1548018 RepID=A0A347VT57_9HELI|nr:metallophosphoesterase family protein [Helicobacter saguini]MWV62229.1 hypothetical protein [Helicobacter saguini]MWV67098.1 hypothetical protein [Helicobacter saguini]MWV69448.1 hypothetical protein [Helicobacter saguini]MWV70999.1 hypothetical protein [Helicobacter saguini]TLD92917.1 hypothetical protein LS64_009505 [Helicobacter saguini]
MKITPETFVISDTHFGDKMAIKKYPIRAVTLNATHFKSFDELAISRWNEVVGEQDCVLHLGDVFAGSGVESIAKLNGKKTLILGNNDIGKCENLNKDFGWKVISKIKFKLDSNEKSELKKAMKKKWGEELKNPYACALVVVVNNLKIMFSHFPVGERKKNDRYCKARDIIDYAYALAGCEINIHGHIHVRSSVQEYCCNVSTEKLDFKPRRLREILSDWANG